ncbi:MAG: ThuA domain-containing protein [Cyclobacteriaceae bacterium]|nr:ThuA domain-containing protein [Cyclobacteriaceae bacterium]
MKNALTIIAITILSLNALHTVGQQKILVITGGHDFEEASFYEMFNSFSDVAFDTISQPAANALLTNQSAMKKYDCLVYYDMVQEISDEQKAAWIQLLKKGKGVVFLHHSLVSYQDWPEFRNIIGGKYLLKPEGDHAPSTYRHDVDMQIHIVNKEHPVCRGVTDFVIHDEVYGGYVVNAEVTPLLKTDHPESTAVVGWCNNYQKSRIVYLQGGHDHAAYENENYRRLLLNAIQWVSGGK